LKTHLEDDLAQSEETTESRGPWWMKKIGQKSCDRKRGEVKETHIHFHRFVERKETRTAGQLSRSLDERTTTSLSFRLGSIRTHPKRNDIAAYPEVEQHQQA